MRHLLTKALIGSGVLLSSITAQAQVYGSGSWDRGRLSVEFGRTQNSDPSRSLFDQVRRDLGRAESISDRYNYGRNRGHFNKVRKEMGEFQSKLANGRFDRHELDDVIKSLQRVVNDNNYGYREGDNLRADLDRLREFRGGRY